MHIIQKLKLDKKLISHYPQIQFNNEFKNEQIVRHED